jgi:TPR repeat protein
MSLLFRLVSLATSAKSARTSLQNAQASAKRVQSTVKAVQSARFQQMQIKLERGDAAAQYDLGERYYEGQGVPPDYTQAFNWFLKAAEQGHSKSQSNVGMMYFVGRGVARDYIEAYKWIHLAARAGEESALRARTTAARRMTAEEIAQGKRRAEEFLSLRSGGPQPR